MSRGGISILMKLPGQCRINFRLQALISIAILRNNTRGNNQDNKVSQRMERRRHLNFMAAVSPCDNGRERGHFWAVCCPGGSSVRIWRAAIQIISRVSRINTGAVMLGSKPRLNRRHFHGSNAAGNLSFFSHQPFVPGAGFFLIRESRSPVVFTM